MVSGPGRLRAARPDRLVVGADRAGELLVRVRWSRWLAVSGPAGACLARSGDWTVLRVRAPGVYRLTGSVLAAGPRC